MEITVSPGVYFWTATPAVEIVINRRDGSSGACLFVVAFMMIHLLVEKIRACYDPGKDYHMRVPLSTGKFYL